MEQNYVFHHPCNGCITKALCREVCQDFRDHTEMVEMSIFILWLIIFSGVLITLFCYLDEWMPNLYANVIIVGYLLIFYGILLHDIKTNFKDFRTMKWWEKLIIGLIFPTALPATRVWEYVDNRIDWTTSFKFRHNKKFLRK